MSFGSKSNDENDWKCDNRDEYFDKEYFQCMIDENSCSEGKYFNYYYKNGNLSN